MTIAVTLLEELTQNNYIVPKPVGVRINYAFSTVPVFAYGLNTPSLKGYEQGSWAALTEG